MLSIVETRFILGDSREIQESAFNKIGNAEHSERDN